MKFAFRILRNFCLPNCEAIAFTQIIRSESGANESRHLTFSKCQMSTKSSINTLLVLRLPESTF